VLEVLMRFCREEHLSVIPSLHQVELARGWADQWSACATGRWCWTARPDQFSAIELAGIYQRERSAEAADEPAAAPSSSADLLAPLPDPALSSRSSVL
jgi:ABC-type phosphate/phosphonate transport system ATPase subunit